ncbi:dTMP kinase [Glaciecola sp. MH2013]|uniref:dTMP kinase n=1 Tax=Glaciecola sp. MH2013 TaxID=2785524 RepID=UPI00189DB28F|nr:dTMP kinase [Glaciecola sp. MH2013]MBF7072908.1 dTMP kinase [Glaciecola sp. MH2013]
MSPSFIVIEGLEGAGKSSAISQLTSFIANKGHDVICTREPGGTPMSEAIRECVKHDWNERVTEETELLLMYAARSQLVENVIKPALESGTWVIGDRHDWSTIAYQGGGRGIQLEKLGALRSMTLGNFTPDLSIYLDVEPSIGLQRARGRGELDRIELAGLGFFERARTSYKELVATHSNAIEINAMQTMDKVQSDLIEKLNEWYARTQADIKVGMG